MKLSIKLTLTTLLWFSALIALFYFKSTSYEYYNHRNTIELSFKEIGTAQQKLDHAVLTNAFFLYANQDEIINGIESVHAHLNTLLHNPHIVSSHPKTLSILLEYQKAYQEKINAIYDFQTANTVIKNSTAAIALLQTKLLDNPYQCTPSQRSALQRITNLSGTMLVAKNAMDTQLIISMRHEIDALKTIPFPPSQQPEISLLLSHFNVIIDTFPNYSSTLNQINKPTLNILLERAKKSFNKESMKELNFIRNFSYFLIILFIGSIVLITLFLIRSEYESSTDRLTGLGNRKAYEERVKHAKVDLGLILINIRKFKHYNDFYGVAAGDQLLVETATHIRSLPFRGEKPTYYRLGADDFGIVYRCSSELPIETLAQELLDAFSALPIIIDGEIRTPLIVVAGSISKPLLETADMALKSNARVNPVIYHEGLNLRQVIHDNVTKAQELKIALKTKKVIPYFQPIVDLSTNKATKHEILARIVTDSGQICSIFPYLSIAKEANLYPLITQTIIEQSFPIIADHVGDFSINISIDDITNSKTVSLIEDKLQEFPHIGDRVIFEILESEAIEEYEDIVAFVQKMRQYGCRIAIDDFGSGYSNFSRILNLTIDIIKIDGSLIRHLDTDTKAITIVQMIVNFTNSASIQTVAEFVHNQTIANIVSKLGIDEAQGFFFSEPLPQPLI